MRCRTCASRPVRGVNVRAPAPRHASCTSTDHGSRPNGLFGPRHSRRRLRGPHRAAGRNRGGRASGTARTARASRRSGHRRHPGTPRAYGHERRGGGRHPGLCLSPCHGFNGVVSQFQTSVHYTEYLANTASATPEPRGPHPEPHAGTATRSTGSSSASAATS